MVGTRRRRRANTNKRQVAGVGNSTSLRAMARVPRSLPVLDATKPHILTVVSKAVITIDDGYPSIINRYLSRGIFDGGSLVGFGNYDGHLNGLIAPYRWFRVARLRFDLFRVASDSSGATVVVGYNPGVTTAPNAGTLLDNEHSMMVTSGNAHQTMTLERGDISPESERWYNGIGQAVRNQVIGGTTVTTIEPSIEDCMPGSFGIGTTASGTTGSIATLIVTTTIELTSYV